MNAVASPAKRIGLALKLARAHYTPVVVAAALAGGLYEFWRGVPLHWVNLPLAVFGAFFAHLAANVINDVYDFASGVDTLAPTRDSPDFGGSNVLTGGLMAAGEAFAWGVGFAVAALGLGTIIALSVGWGVLLPAFAGAIVAFQYVAPPLRFGYLGHGLGEIGILVAFGPLTVAGAAWAVGGAWSWGSAALGIPVGVNIVAILYCHHFTHPEADREKGKMSPVAVLGKAGGLRLAWVLPVLSMVTLVALVGARVVPLLALLALLGPALFATALARVKPDADMETFGNLTRAAAGAATVGGLSLAVALLVSRLAGW
jgi:1,4-dihydroxy-2-naphthoate octaprenyltransferase